MYSVEFAYNIVPSDEAGQGLSNLLIRQLAAIESGKGLQQAARSLGVSYRYFWGQIEIWEERFGQKLVIREQGKRARLSPLGQKLLWAERTVMANYAVQMEKMRTELNAAFAAACNPDADIVTIAGCFDPWLATLPAFLFPSHLIADLQFSTSVSGLRALADEKCDFAGFNFPRGAGREKRPVPSLLSSIPKPCASVDLPPALRDWPWHPEIPFASPPSGMSCATAFNMQAALSVPGPKSF